MELLALRTFEAVVDEGGILAASRKLNTVRSNVTARIRRRQEAHSLAGETTDTDAATHNTPPPSTPPRATPMTFQERIAQERQQNAEGEGQSPS